MIKVGFHALSQRHCLLAQSLVTALQHDVTQEVLMSSSASIKPFMFEAEFHTYSFCAPWALNPNDHITYLKSNHVVFT